MPIATDRAKQIALAVGRKYPDYSLKVVPREATILFIEIEVWRNSDKSFMWSDSRSAGYYEQITAERVKQVVDSLQAMLDGHTRKKHG